MIDLICFEIKKFFRRPKNIISIFAFGLLICVYIFSNNSTEKRFLESQVESVKKDLQSQQQLIEEAKIKLKEEYKNKEYVKKINEVIISSEKAVSLLEQKSLAMINKNWREQLKVDILLGEHKKEDILAGRVVTIETIKDIDKLINKDKFLFNNDIKPICEYFNMTSYNFMKKFNTEMLVVIMVFILTLSSDIISNENDEGTFKILLIQPMSRTKVILSKIISATVICTLIMTIMLCMFFVVLGLTKGFGSPNYPVEILINNKIETISIRKFVLYTIPIQALSIVFIVALGVLISTLIQNSISSISISVIVAITMYIFNNQLKLFGAIRGILPFSYMNAADVVSGNTMTLFSNKTITYLIAMTILGVYSFVFYIISIAVFRKKDIQC